MPTLRPAAALLLVSIVACAAEDSRPIARVASPPAPTPVASSAAAPTPVAPAAPTPAPPRASRLGRPTLLDRHAGEREPPDHLRGLQIATTSDGAVVVWTGDELQRRSADGELQGRLAFAPPASGWSDVVVGGLATDRQGRLVLFGRHSSGFHLGDRVVSPKRQIWEAFLAQIDASMKLSWLTTLPGSAEDEPSAFAVTGEGSLFAATQVYADSPNLRAGAITKLYDLVARSVSSRGQVTWTRSLAKGSNAEVASIAIDPAPGMLVSLRSSFLEQPTLERWSARGQLLAKVELPVGQVAVDASGRPFLLTKSNDDDRSRLIALDDRLQPRWERAIAADEATMAVRPDGRVVIALSGRGGVGVGEAVRTAPGRRCSLLVQLGAEGEVVWTEDLPDSRPASRSFGGLAIALGADATAFVGLVLNDERMDELVAPGDGWGRVLARARLDP